MHVPRGQPPGAAGDGGAGRGWRALWLAVAAATQFLWGCYPVIVRLFQTQVAHPLTGMQLNLVINALAVPGLLLCYSLPIRVCAWPRRRQAVLPKLLIAPRGAEPTGGSPGSRRFEPLLSPPAPRTPGGLRRISLLEDSASSRADLQEAYRAALRVEAAGTPSAAGGTPSAAGGTPSAAASPRFSFSSGRPLELPGTPPGAGRREEEEQPLLLGFDEDLETALLGEEHVSVEFAPVLPLYRWFSPYALAIVTAVVLAALSLTLIYSVRLTRAHWCQMLFLLAPVFVALFSRALFRIPLPGSLWAAMALMLAGSAMVIVGQGGGEGGQPLAWHDAAGLALALVSAVSLAAYMILVQRTKDLVSEEVLLWVNYGTQVLLSLALTLALERGELHRLSDLGAHEWAGLASLAMCIHWGANFTQQVTIRHLGPPLTAMFLPTRLVGAVAASYFLLGERLTTGTEWGGMLVVVCTTSWYLWQNLAVQQQQQQQQHSE